MFEGMETKEANKPQGAKAEDAHEPADEPRDKPAQIETKEGGHGAAFDTPEWMDD